MLMVRTTVDTTKSNENRTIKIGLVLCSAVFVPLLLIPLSLVYTFITESDSIIYIGPIGMFWTLATDDYR